MGSYSLSVGPRLIYIVGYADPIILVSIMGYSVKRRGYDPISEFDGVNIKVVPEFIRVFRLC